MRRPGEVSLERALSKLGVASRRIAREWIAAGRVSVAGSQELNPGRPVIPERAGIAVDGQLLSRAPWRSVLLNKPRGVVTTASDPQGRATVFDLLDREVGHLAPVGRLDQATSGLLLLTNDTRLADWLCDPANGVERTYLVTVRGDFGPEAVRQAEAGVEFGGERLAFHRLELRKRSRRESHLTVVLTEGRNREIRRLLAAFGREVTRLRRVAFGGLVLGDLKPGEWRAVPREEIEAHFPNALVGNRWGQSAIRGSIANPRPVRS